MDNNFFAKHVKTLSVYGAGLSGGTKFESDVAGTYIAVSDTGLGSRSQPNIAMFVEGLNIGYYSRTDNTFNYFGREQVRAIYPEAELDTILKTILHVYLTSEKDNLDPYRELTAQMRSKDFRNETPMILNTLIQTGFLEQSVLRKRPWYFDLFKVEYDDMDKTLFVTNEHNGSQVLLVKIDLENKDDPLSFEIFDSSLSQEIACGIFCRLYECYGEYLTAGQLVTTEPELWNWIDGLDGVRRLNALWIAWALFGVYENNEKLAGASGRSVFNRATASIARDAAVDINVAPASYNVRVINPNYLTFQVVETKSVVVF